MKELCKIRCYPKPMQTGISRSHSAKRSLAATRLSIIITLFASACFARASSISGNVYDIVTGRALSGITVAAENIDSIPRDSFPDDSIYLWYYETTTDDSGGYIFSELPPGRYSVYEYVSGSEYPEIIDNCDGMDDSGINIGLLVPDRDTFSIIGEVNLLESFGYPWFGEVTVFSNHGQIIGQAFVISGDSLSPLDTNASTSQTYEIENLPLIGCKVASFVFDYLPQYFDHAYTADTAADPVIPGRDSINFDMELGSSDRLYWGEISGIIRGRHGPLSYASVFARKENKLIKGSISNYDGSYDIFGLEPGTYTVYATRPGYYTKVYNGTITIADQWVDGIDITLVATEAVEESDTDLSQDLFLEAYPNPFALNTSIRYVVPETGLVSLKIYDATGSLVRTLVKGIEQAGEHTQCWDAADSRGKVLPSGVYFARLVRSGQISSKRLLLIR